MDLTSEQQAVVAHRHGHARIVAVAGAGKTAALTHYLATRVATSERKILVLMYNRAAQQAFSARLQRLCGAAQATPQVRTFHALGLRMYKRLIGTGLLTTKRLQPVPEITIELQLKQLLQQTGEAQTLIDTPEQLQEWTEQCRQFITLVKSDVAPPETVVERMSLGKGGDKVLLAVFSKFEQWREQQQVITYDDMLYDPAQALLHQPQSRQLFANLFDEILVDEYQDINPVQHFLLKTLAGTRAQVMVIGDPDQTIYEFRGSSPLFITSHFERDFAGATTYSLTRTFRFGHALALCANQLISRNRVREPILTISAESTAQSRVKIARCDHHGVKIADTIAALNSNGGPYNGMAVLCRLWSFARPVELELMARAIPYRIEGEQSILQCAEIRPFLHALDIISGELHHLDQEQRQQRLFELLTSPSLKIPHALLRRLCANWSRTIIALPLRKSFLQALPPGLTPYQQRTLDTVAAALNQLDKNQPGAAALQGYATVLDVAERLRRGALDPEKGQEQARTVTAFLQFLAATPAQSAAQLRERLAQMLVQTENNRSAHTTDAVTLTTIHRSKGLEWPVVFLPNLCEGHLPCAVPAGRERPEQERSRMESERRLMYVAITRAQKQLFITAPDSSAISRFIGEMNIPLSQKVATALQHQEQRVELAQQPGTVMREYLGKLPHAPEIELKLDPHSAKADSSVSEWSVGDRVEHAVLGLGKICALDQQRIHIQFDDGKTRTFVGDLARPHLSFAREA